MHDFLKYILFEVLPIFEELIPKFKIASLNLVVQISIEFLIVKNIVLKLY